MAFIVHESSVDVDQDLRRRFAEIEQLDVLKSQLLQDTLSNTERLRAQVEQLKALNHELKEQLAISDSQLAESNKKRKRETQDLDSEKETRRQCQERVEILSARVAAVDQGKFMLVLIDADAQTNLFRDEYLTRGMDGGHAAADVLKEKVQEHLVNGLGASVEKTKALPIMIKAFANLEGLSNYCIKSQRLRSQDALSKFWAGFSRSSALVDFIDVGRGKEEADSKLREVLAFYINNPLCTHIMLMCCHDAGYIPVLRPYSVKSMLSQKITLISTGGILPSIAALNFRSTKIFEPLFSGIGSPKSANQATLQLSKRVHEQHKSTPIVTSQAKECSQVSPTGSTGSGQASSTGANAKSVYQIGRPIGHENFVANAHRLGPVLRNSAGRRIDKKLPFAPWNERVQSIRNMNICSWHYLRSDHCVHDCARSHDKLERPLTSEDHDALRVITRLGFCHRLKNTGDCDDEFCI